MKLQLTVEFEATYEFVGPYPLAELKSYSNLKNCRGVYFITEGAINVINNNSIELFNQDIVYIGKSGKQTIYKRLDNHRIEILGELTKAGKDKVKIPKKFDNFRKRIKYEINGVYFSAGLVEVGKEYVSCSFEEKLIVDFEKIHGRKPEINTL